MTTRRLFLQRAVNTWLKNAVGDVAGMDAIPPFLCIPSLTHDPTRPHTRQILSPDEIAKALLASGERKQEEEAIGCKEILRLRARGGGEKRVKM